jgi:protein disulfide-isomerase A1
MKGLVFVCLLFTVLFTSTLASEVEEHVLVLNDANFDEELKNHNYLMIEFYAPWCGHCQHLAPEYSKAAEILAKENPPLYLAKVDATQNNDLSARFQLQGYPTLKWYSKGEFSEYPGGRTADDIVNWIKKKTGPVTKELNGKDDVEAFKAANTVAVVFFGEDADRFGKFTDIASSVDEANFGHCKTDECKKAYGVTGSYEVILFKKFDEGENRLASFESKETLINFIEENSVQSLAPFDERTADFIFGKNKDALFYIRPKHDADEYDHIFKKLAPEFKGRIIFVACDIKEELESRLAEYFGLTEANLPHVRIVSVKGDEDVPVFVFHEKITEKNIRSFINDFEGGKLMPYYKSEEIPEKQEGPVMVLVGKSFEKEVFESGKNVLVEFYAPWCGHCKNLEPEYNKVAETYKHIPDLVIAKMDATANEVEGITVHGYPTLKLFKAGDRNPTNLEGQVNGVSISEFLNKELNLDVTYEFIAEEKSDEGHEHKHDETLTLDETTTDSSDAEGGKHIDL